jgi:hypothetical protein
MKKDDTQTPHAVGIEETAGSEVSQDRLTPCGISNVPTDDVLRTAGELKEIEVAGLMADAGYLGEDRAALAPEKGFSDVPADGYPQDTSVASSDPLQGEVTDGEVLNGGFLGRYNNLRVR